METHRNVDKSNEGQSVKRDFCSSASSSSSSSDSFSANATVPIEGVPVTGDVSKNTAEANQVRSRFCSNTNDRFSRDQLTTIYKQVASPLIVNKWSECMTLTYTHAHADPVEFKISRVSPTTVEVHAKFNPQQSEQKAPVIDHWHIDGAVCTGGRFAKGRSIPVQGVSELCKQTTRTDVIAMIGTTYGDFRASEKGDLSGVSAGTVRVLYSAPSTSWVPGPQQTAQRTTGDHHCSRNCRKQPTRTNYQITIDAGANERFVDPVELKCIGGPCNGWNEIMSVHQNGERALGSFDVWTHPTTWELRVGSERKTSTMKRFYQEGTSIKYGGTLSLMLPAEARNIMMEVSRDGQKATYDLEVATDERFEILNDVKTSAGRKMSVKILR